MHNPLVPSVLQALRELATPVKITGIVELLKEPLSNFFVDEPEETRLFKTNFLIMNALFQLQGSFYQKDALYLDLNPLDIRLYPLIKREGQAVAHKNDLLLKEYYGDWSHFEQISKEGVEELLDQFWSYFNNVDQRTEALAVLGCKPESSWGEIRQAYRRLAQLNHPDLGGSEQRFLEIREAYEVLRSLYAGKPQGC
ncbi:DNA-J related domain-containing protein [Agaribacterium sp. ZY112]|uniref:DNA-J related domain-containing protein n=1 Tax=Agaribacterium sp. ZY112 TaxID=3233574 RepID=UPI00352378BA